MPNPTPDNEKTDRNRATNDGTPPAGGEANNETQHREERNNNKNKPMQFPTKRNRHIVTGKKRRQILIHQVPVRFPVAGNLMENVESLGYIYGALSNINEPDNLPGDVVVNATLLNRMENN